MKHTFTQSERRDDRGASFSPRFFHKICYTNTFSSLKFFFGISHAYFFSFWGFFQIEIVNIFFSTTQKHQHNRALRTTMKKETYDRRVA